MCCQKRSDDDANFWIHLQKYVIIAVVYYHPSIQQLWNVSKNIVYGIYATEKKAKFTEIKSAILLFTSDNTIGDKLICTL